MKLIMFIFLFGGLFIQSISTSAAPISKVTGDWSGAIKLPAASLTLVLHITPSDQGFSGTLDSPDQSAYGIQGAELELTQTTVSLKFPSIAAKLTAELVDDKLQGQFFQGGMQFPITFTRSSKTQGAALRPQTPQGPFPYQEQQLYFNNKVAKLRLAGTLTLPRGPIKAAVALISGSGPQNRDQEIVGHKPFWVIADYLSRRGYAVLRFDDRGTAESEGEFNRASLYDFAEDAEAAVQYLRSYPRLKNLPTGLIGHSEGAAVAGLVAAQTKRVDFIVMLAGPGLPGAELYRQQISAILRASVYPKQKLPQKLRLLDDIVTLVENQPLDKDLSQALTPLVSEYVRLDLLNIPQAGIKNHIAIYNAVWFRAFIKFQPASAYANIKIPVFALAAGKDLQVLQPQNNRAIEVAINKKGSPSLVSSKILPGLNHLFQESDTGKPEEYAKIEQTFAPQALSALLSGLNAMLRK